MLLETTASIINFRENIYSKNTAKCRLSMKSRNLTPTFKCVSQASCLWEQVRNKIPPHIRKINVGFNFQAIEKKKKKLSVLV